MFPTLLLAALMVCPPPEETPERLAVPPTAVAPAPADPRRVTGTWTRDTEMTRMTFAFADSKLTIAFTFAPPEGSSAPGFTATLDADYAVSPEGVVHGVITGGDAEPACVGAAVQLVVGHPFALRARTEAGVTTIRDVKFFGASVPSHTPLGPKKPVTPDEMTVADAVAAVVAVSAGRYLADDGKRPAKKPAAPTTRAVVPLSPPSPAYPEAQPASFLPAAPPSLLPPANLPPLAAATAEPPLLPAAFAPPAADATQRLLPPQSGISPKE